RNAAIYDKAGQAARHGTSSALVARRWCRSFGFATKDPSGALWRTAGRGRRSEIPCVQNFRASDASAAGRRAVDAASAEDTGSSGGHVDSAGTTHREDCAASAAAPGHNQCAAIPGHAQSLNSGFQPGTHLYVICVGGPSGSGEHDLALRSPRSADTTASGDRITIVGAANAGNSIVRF